MVILKYVIITEIIVHLICFKAYVLIGVLVSSDDMIY
jgi:hypothetical protein